MGVIATLYLALPAFTANMAPVAAARWQWLERLNRPLDAKRTWRGQRVFGDHKTWRGLTTGVGVGTLTAIAQYFLPHPAALPYTTFTTAAAFGALGGFGALSGDAVKSFIKRQCGIASGKPFIPFDYLDYIIGFIVVTWPLHNWSGSDIAIVVTFSLVANPLTNAASYALGIKSTPW